MRARLRVAATEVSIRRFLGVRAHGARRIIRASVMRRPGALRTRRCSSSSSRRCCAGAPRRAWSVGGGWWSTRRTSRPMAFPRERRAGRTWRWPSRGRPHAQAHSVERDRGGRPPPRSSRARRTGGRPAEPYPARSHAAPGDARGASWPGCGRSQAARDRRGQDRARDRSEADALETLIARARFAGHSPRELAADAGYAGQDADKLLDARRGCSRGSPRCRARRPGRPRGPAARGIRQVSVNRPT